MGKQEAAVTLLLRNDEAAYDRSRISDFPPNDVYMQVLDSLTQIPRVSFSDQQILDMCSTTHHSAENYGRLPWNDGKVARDDSFQDPQIIANIAWFTWKTQGPKIAYSRFMQHRASWHSTEELVTHLCLATAIGDDVAVAEVLPQIIEHSPRFIFSVLGERYRSDHERTFMTAISIAKDHFHEQRDGRRDREGALKAAASLAVLELYLGRIQDADADVRLALASLPDLAGAWLTLAEIEAVENNDSESVIRDLHRVVLLNPDDPVAREAFALSNDQILDLHGQQIWSDHANQVSRFYHVRLIVRNDVVPSSLTFLDQYEPSQTLIMAGRMKRATN